MVMRITHILFSMKDLSDSDLGGLRKEYASLITKCDYHLGRILDFFDDHNKWKDTMLIINTDHGFLLGEHDVLGKNVFPMYDDPIHETVLFCINGGQANLYDGKWYYDTWK